MLKLITIRNLHPVHKGTSSGIVLQFAGYNFQRQPYVRE